MASHDLVGLHYERPFDLLEPDADGDPWRVVSADFVTVEDGTGIVHLAPAFGEIDREVGEREGPGDAVQVDERRFDDRMTIACSGRELACNAIGEPRGRVEEI